MSATTNPQSVGIISLIELDVETLDAVVRLVRLTPDPRRLRLAVDGRHLRVAIDSFSWSDPVGDADLATW